MSNRWGGAGKAGAGAITQVTTDTPSLIQILTGTGPVVHVNAIGAGTGTVQEITSIGGTVSITDATGPDVNLDVGTLSNSSISGTTGTAELFEYENPAGATYSVLVFNNYTNTSPETLTFDIPFIFGNVGIPSWGSSPALTLSPTQVSIPIIASALTGAFIIMGA